MAWEAARRQIDASGRIVVPGFVDIHTHSDLSLISDGRARSKILQGVTTEVVGNCGLGPFPLVAGAVQRTRDAIAIIDLDKDVRFDWTGFSGYRTAVEQAHPAINVVGLVGHIPLRVAAAPGVEGPLTAGQLDRLVDLLDEQLQAGAFGFSTGLMYPPAMSADQKELEAIAQVVASRGRLFSIHARNYSSDLLSAVDEAISLALATGCRLQFSHLAVAGRKNWGSVALALERIDDARAKGADVGVDIYPYLAGSANLSQILPEWAQEGGSDAIAERLESPQDRRTIIDQWQETMVLGFDEIVVSLVDGDLADILGLTIEQIAERWSTEPAEAILDIICRSRNRAMMVAYGRSMEDLLAVLRHPAASIGSDGLALDRNGATGAGLPHPRSYGCYPRFIGRMVPEGHVTLERAIEMCTSLPAARIGLHDRGSLTLGAMADITVFDLDTFIDQATFEAPAQFPSGLEYVLVAGQVVVDAGQQLDDVRPGRFLVAT